MPILSKHQLGLITITLAWVIWGAHPIAVKLSLDSIPIFTLIFIRLILSTLILLPFTIKELRKHKLTLHDWYSFFIASLFGITLNIFFYFIGISQTQVIDSSLIGSFTPIMNILAAAIFLKEAISRHEKIGVALGFLGTLIILINPLFNYQGNIEKQMVGNMFILLAGVTWVSFTIFTKGLFKRFEPFFVTSMTILMGMFTLIPFMLWEQTGSTEWVNKLTPLTIGSVLYMTIFSTILAYFLFEWGLKYVKAAMTGILSNVHLVVTGVLGVMILQEKIDLAMLAGGFLIILGVIYSSFNDSPYHRHHQHKHR